MNENMAVTCHTRSQRSQRENKVRGLVVMRLVLSGALVMVFAAVVSGAPADRQTFKPTTAAEAKALPPVDDILAQNIQAMGGRAAMFKVTSRVLKGTLQIAGQRQKMPWEMQCKAPNKRLTMLTLPNRGQVLDGFDGKVAWSKQPQTPVQEKTGDELEQLKRECEFYRELKLKDMFANLAVEGREQIAGCDVYVVLAKPRAGQPEKFYFEARTGLLLRHDCGYTNAMGNVSIRSYLKDYRTVDGVTVPFATTVEITTSKVSEAILNVQCTEIKLNVPIPEARFQKPKE